MTLKLALVACLVLGAYAQTPAPTPAVPQAAPQVSADTMTIAVYSSLLRRAEAVESLAVRAEASGKDPSHRSRKKFQGEIGLTDQESTMVWPILLDAISATKAKRAEAQAAAAAATAAGAGAAAGPRPPLTTEQKLAIGALNTQREQIVLAHVHQIEAALGPSRFQQFDDTVRKLIGPSMKIIPLGKN